LLVKYYCTVQQKCITHCKHHQLFFDFRSLEQLPAKPASENQDTQTDTVAFICEERGTQTDVDTGFPDVDVKVITKAEFVLPKNSAIETTKNEKECEILPNITDN